jgi:hypothetical protein
MRGYRTLIADQCTGKRGEKDLSNSQKEYISSGNYSAIVLVCAIPWDVREIRPPIMDQWQCPATPESLEPSTSS